LKSCHEKNKYDVCVVVCTFNRSAILKECLSSLLEQTVPGEVFQVLVIDNNSTDDTKNIVRDCGRVANLRYLVEWEQGLSYARNKGMRCADADWIIYLDDDTRVPRDFIEKALYTISHFPFDCFGGLYLPWFKYRRPCWFRDEYASNGKLLSTVGVLEKGYASGGIVAFNKERLKRLGGFPISLGMSGKRVAYGEENYVQKRLKESGGIIGFNPDWTVDHLVAEYKLNPWWFVRSKYAVGRDSVHAYGLNWRFPLLVKKGLGALFYLFVDLLSAFLKLRRKNYYVQNIIVEVFGIFSWKVGQIVGASRLLIRL